jgi:hypothetical protein
MPRAEINITRDDAIALLSHLATDGHELRTRIEAGRQSARDALLEHGIDVSLVSLPKEIKLPDAKHIAHLRDHAQAMVASGRGPFGWFVLGTVFGAMPIVVAPQGDGPG